VDALLLFVAFVVAVLATLGLAAWISGTRWRAASRQTVARLLAARRPSPAAGLDPAALQELPPPVRRFLERSLPAGARRVTTAQVEQEGQFRLGTSERGWRPFRATQVFTTSPPGFCWDARIRMAPGVPVLVRDGYACGRGHMLGALFGVFTVARAEGTPEMAAGALQRYLAETMWFPSALLPGGCVAWHALREDAAVATLTDGGTSVSLEFRFNTEGDMAGVFTEARFREVGGRYEPAPWGARVLAWAEHDGTRIASDVEVGWYEDGVFAPFYRGRVTAVRCGADAGGWPGRELPRRTADRSGNSFIPPTAG
jgi:hypothetical protein